MNEPFKRYWWFMAYGMLLITSSYPETLRLMNSPALNQKPEMRAILGVIALLGFIIAMTLEVGKEKREMMAQKPKSAQTEAKKVLRVSSPSISSSTETRKVMPGQIIGLLLGIGFLFSGIFGDFSLMDSPQMYSFGFLAVGLFFIISNIITLAKGGQIIKTSGNATVAPAKVSRQSDDEESDRVRCRFCGKKYSADYNGCPHCKKR